LTHVMRSNCSAHRGKSPRRAGGGRVELNGKEEKESAALASAGSGVFMKRRGGKSKMTLEGVVVRGGHGTVPARKERSMKGGRKTVVPLSNLPLGETFRRWESSRTSERLS